MPIGNSVRCLARCESQIKRGAFGIREERAGLIIPECLYLLFVNTLIKCAQRRVRLAKIKMTKENPLGSSFN